MSVYPVHSKLVTVSQLIDKLQSTKKDLQQLKDMNAQLEKQCDLQAKEVSILEKEKLQTESEMQQVVAQVENLIKEKVKMEMLLKDLKKENQELGATFK